MMSLKKTLATDWPVMIVLLVPFILIALTWSSIPEVIPTHWNIRGEIDNWGPKGFVIFLLPLASLFIYLILVAVPYIDPKRKAESEQKAIRAFRFILPLLLTGIFLVLLMQWVGIDIPVGKGIGLAVTLMFIALGNYLQSLRPNYFIGLRTPWTLENTEIWRKTHRFGGKLWVAGGVTMLVIWFFVSQETFFFYLIGGALAFALTPAAYSFYLYVKDRQSTDEKMA